MKITTYKCDHCGAEIIDVVYTLTCYAEDLKPGPVGGMASEVVLQNSRQNLTLQAVGERHLCRKCKDEITAGIFVV